MYYYDSSPGDPTIPQNALVRLADTYHCCQCCYPLSTHDANGINRICTVNWTRSGHDVRRVSKTGRLLRSGRGSVVCGQCRSAQPRLSCSELISATVTRERTSASVMSHRWWMLIIRRAQTASDDGSADRLRGFVQQQLPSVVPQRTSAFPLHEKQLGIADSHILRLILIVNNLLVIIIHPCVPSPSLLGGHRIWRVGSDAGHNQTCHISPESDSEPQGPKTTLLHWPGSCLKYA